MVFLSLVGEDKSHCQTGLSTWITSIHNKSSQSGATHVQCSIKLLPSKAAKPRVMWLVRSGVGIMVENSAQTCYFMRTFHLIQMAAEDGI